MRDGPSLTVARTKRLGAIQGLNMMHDHREVGTTLIEVTGLASCSSLEHGRHARRNALKHDKVSGSIDQLWDAEGSKARSVKPGALPVMTTRCLQVDDSVLKAEGYTGFCVANPTAIQLRSTAQIPRISAS